MFKKILVFIDNLFYRGLMRNLLKMSKLGYGFVVSGAESGVNFEHVYDNKAQGSFIIGKYVDRALLDLPAVKATRARKDDIKKIIWNEIENNQITGKKTHVLDLASGGARYLRELSQEHCDGKVFSLCVDKDAKCTALGESLTMKEGLKNIRFFTADVFRLNHLMRFSRRNSWIPNIIIASGIFIYFNDDIVKKMLQEIYAALDSNGIVVFTSYERLNTRKLMRKAMVTSKGEQWSLYYRTPEYWRTELSTIGFKDILIIRDQWLMNNVCVGRKR